MNASSLDNQLSDEFIDAIITINMERHIFNPDFQQMVLRLIQQHGEAKTIELIKNISKNVE